MSLKENTELAWGVVILLAIVILVLVGSMLYRWHESQPLNMRQVLEDGKVNITAVRDQIRLDCAREDDASKKQCAQDLQTLGDTLREFSSDVAHATTTAQ